MAQGGAPLGLPPWATEASLGGEMSQGGQPRVRNTHFGSFEDVGASERMDG
jgi:hypothetical protein